MNSQDTDGSPARKREAATARPDTLDRLLSHNAARLADRTALSDPPNRARLEGRSDGFEGHRYSYRQAQEVMARLAAHFAALGLERGDYVAVQTAHFAETPLLVLALMRAGLVPCMMPLTWSMGELERSFERFKPRVLVSCGRIEGVNGSEVMRELAFRQTFVRFVMGVGYDIADGVTDLSPLFTPDEAQNPPPGSNPQNATDMTALALVTYKDPVTPVPHTHGQILSTGLFQVLLLGLAEKDHLLSPYPLSSMPGLAGFFYPWLVSGASLSLHHPFDLKILQEQLGTGDISYLAAPEQAVSWLLQSGLEQPDKLGIVWSKHHLPSWQSAQTASMADNSTLYDLWNLGGLGLAGAKRDGLLPTGLFRNGQLCLPANGPPDLCLGAGEIRDGLLFVQGRIFPDHRIAAMSLEFFNLKQQIDEGWLNTGLNAHKNFEPGSDYTIVLGEDEAGS